MKRACLRDVHKVSSDTAMGSTIMLRHAIFLGLVAVMLAVSPVAMGSGQPPTEASLQAKGAKRLTAADFASLYVGNTLTGTTADGEAFHVLVETQSSYRMLYQGKRTTDRWSASPAGEFCSTADGETSCTREYMLDQVIYSFNPDGTFAGTARIRPGNPEKL